MSILGLFLPPGVAGLKLADRGVNRVARFRPRYLHGLPATRLGVRNTRNAFARPIAIVDGFAGRVECLPGNPSGVIDPGLFRLRIAARRRALLNERAPGPT